jgi:alkaline phosphatase D
MNGGTRRDFLRKGAALAATGLVGCGSGEVSGRPSGRRDDGVPAPGGGGLPPAPPAPPPLASPLAVDAPERTPESTLFPLGIASGDALPSAAVVWTRYAGTSPLRVVVWEMDGDRYAREAFASDVTPAEGGFVHVDATGLGAGARYRFAFFEMRGAARVARSPIGRFRSALGESDLAPLVFGGTACMLNGMALDTLARAAERTDLDAFMLLGDTSYNDGARTRAEYRDRWRMNLGAEAHRRLRAATSVVATWDDHEVSNDWNPETIDPEHLATARAAWFEHLPVRRRPPSPDRIWRSFRWGRTAEIFVLDCRSERKPSTRGTASEQYVSREQLDWLKAGLASSTAVFKLVMNSVPIGSFGGRAFDFGILAKDDRWEGYPRARAEILAHVDDRRLSGVVWVSGDFHLASTGRVSPSGPGSTQLEVLLGPGAQAPNPAHYLLVPPQFDWASDTDNYGALHLDPVARTLRVVHHDARGKALSDRTFTM